MHRSLLAVIASVSLFGCTAVNSLTHARLSDEGHVEQAKEEMALRSPGTDKESPVATYGKDFDRISGIEYDWTIRENGTAQLKGKDPVSGQWVQVVAPLQGDVYTVDGHTHSVYDPTSDSCQVVGGEKGRGIACIHPMTRHFFLNHKFPTTHPMEARAK